MDAASGNEVSRPGRRRPTSPGALCSCISCCPTEFRQHGAVWHRPASVRSFRLESHQQEFNAGRCIRYVPEDEQFRHENFYPPIILKEDWSKVQILLQQRQRKSPASNSSCHRYAGLLVCGDCGGPFVGINRDWNGKRRVEYICKSYMRHGKMVCPSHRIHEEVLDQAVWGKLNLCHDTAAQELSKVKDLQKRLALRKPVLDARHLSLQAAIQKLEQEIDDILMEKFCYIKINHD